MGVNLVTVKSLLALFLWEMVPVSYIYPNSLTRLSHSIITSSHTQHKTKFSLSPSLSHSLSLSHTHTHTYGYLCFLSIHNKWCFQLNLVINSQNNSLRWKATTVQAIHQSWPYSFPKSQLLPLQLRFHVYWCSCTSSAWRWRASTGRNLFPYATFSIPQAYQELCALALKASNALTHLDKGSSSPEASPISNRPKGCPNIPKFIWHSRRLGENYLLFAFGHGYKSKIIF